MVYAFHTNSVKRVNHISLFPVCDFWQFYFLWILSVMNKEISGRSPDVQPSGFLRLKNQEDLGNSHWRKQRWRLGMCSGREAEKEEDSAGRPELVSGFIHHCVRFHLQISHYYNGNKFKMNPKWPNKNFGRNSNCF